MSKVASKALHDAKADERQRAAAEFNDWCAMRVKLICLGENLRTIGALEYARHLGFRRGYESGQRPDNIEQWMPNVDGKRAPGGPRSTREGES